MPDRAILAFAILAGLAVLALPDQGWPISGPRLTSANAQTLTCVGPFIEHVELLSDYPQLLERVRIVSFCRTDRWYQVIRAWAIRTDGRVGQPFSNERETLCEVPRPEPEVKDRADVLREGR